MTKLILKTLMVGILLIVVGHILMGCDGVGNDNPGDGGVKGGLQRTDAGKIFCDIPSPTGDEKSPYGVGRNTKNFVQVTNDVRGVCEHFKSASPANEAGLAARMDCADAANDFKGTSGMSWCISTADNTSASNCAAKTAGDPNADVTCQATTMDGMRILTNGNGSFPQRVFAACSSAGVFLGWICS